MLSRFLPPDHWVKEANVKIVHASEVFFHT
jgi:hypothetical protein